MKSSKVLSTNQIRGFLCCAILLAAIVGYQQMVGAVSQPRALITEPVSETKLVTLAGNTRPEATAANDRGPVADSFPMEHMLLQLRCAPEQEQALEKYIDELEEPKSPNYHHWLTAQQVGHRYGLAAQDLATIVNWLKAHGFTVNRVYSNGMVIDFSGNAGQVHEAFHTEIHHLEVNGKLHVANMTDPQIPTALAPAVVGVVSLNDFRAQPQSHAQPNLTFPCGNASCYAVMPADLATIYNLNPLFASGLSGQGQTIVVIERSDVYSLNDWNIFRSFLPGSFPDGSVSQVHPGGCTDPGVVTDEEEEPILDAEWASAAAPSASIIVASCAGTDTTPGELLALENLLNANGTPPAIVSNSWGFAEALSGATLNAAVSYLYQTAVTKGVSVFAAAGDTGAAFADQGLVESKDELVASLGINVNGAASTQYNVAVGGTDFGDTFAGTNSTYWSATNGPNGGSALSYVPEIPWNGSCAGGLIARYLGFPSTFGSMSLCNNPTAGETYLLNIWGGGGGPSGCATGAPSIGTCAGYQKPSWQSVLGNPSDGVRDIPDVSLFASRAPWYHFYVFCDSDPADSCGCCGGFGTSFASPIMAGIQSLVNQRTVSRQGNPNPTYYSLAAAEYGASGSSSCNSTLGNGVASSCIFYDVTKGDNDVPCTGTNNCYNPSGTYGVLSTSNSSFQPAYPATVGWDFATGIGTVNAYNLVTAFGTLGAVPESLNHTPTVVNFGNVKVDNVKRITLTLSIPIPINDVPPIHLGNPLATVRATSPQEFRLGVSTCRTQLLPKQECKLSLIFVPASTGPKSSAVTIFDNASNAPQVIQLRGTGK